MKRPHGQESFAFRVALCFARFTSYLFFVWLMYSSLFPDLESFERLGLDDMPPTTRQQEREGRNRHEISYHVNVITDHGEPSYITHVYYLDFSPPNSVLDGIVEQGKNISHVVQVEHVPRDFQQEPHYLIELQEKVTVSVFDSESRSDNLRLQCDCSHQTNERACKHVSFVLDQLLQCYMKMRRNSRPRNTYRMTMNEQGTMAGYWNERGGWAPLKPFSVIENIGEIDFANAISEIRCSLDAVQSLDYRRERIKKYFHGLDEYALRGLFLEPFQQRDRTNSQKDFIVSARDCARELEGLEEDIYRVWDGLSRGGYRDESHSIASEKLIPTLLFLLKGVIIRHQGEVRDGSNRRIVQSCDLYSRLIGQVNRQDLFVLRILRQLPAPYATEEQRGEKQRIARMIDQLNRSVGLQSEPSIRFQNDLEMLWR